MALPKASQIEPLQDRVLVERIDTSQSPLLLTDQPKSLIGIVKAVGPGKWIPGEWWFFGPRWACRCYDVNYAREEYGEWEWLPGHRQPMSVQPGQIVAFNSRWNDLEEQDNLHLIQEADILSVCDKLPKEAYAIPAPEY